MAVAMVAPQAILVRLATDTILVFGCISAVHALLPIQIPPQMQSPTQSPPRVLQSIPASLDSEGSGCRIQSTEWEYNNIYE